MGVFLDHDRRSRKYLPEIVFRRFRRLRRPWCRSENLEFSMAYARSAVDLSPLVFSQVGISGGSRIFSDTFRTVSDFLQGFDIFKLSLGFLELLPLVSLLSL